MIARSELHTVLIETSWNVKTIVCEIKDLKPRINRNIVECKGRCYSLGRFLSNVLIETSWNVKKPRLMDWEQDGEY